MRIFECEGVYVSVWVEGWLYGVATISRLLKIIGLFCKRTLQKRLYSAKETYNFKEPTYRSHPIASQVLPSRTSASHVMLFGTDVFVSLLFAMGAECLSLWCRDCRCRLQHSAIHCITLQHTATHCNTVRHTVTHCNTL